MQVSKAIRFETNSKLFSFSSFDKMSHVVDVPLKRAKHMDVNVDEDSNPSVSSKQATDTTVQQMSRCTLSQLPDELFVFIGTFLKLQDLSHFSRANKRLYKLFHTHSQTWTRFFLEFHLTRSPFLEKIAAGN